MTGDKEIEYEVKRDCFSLVKNIKWEDVINKLDYEFSKNTHRFIFRDEFTPPTFVMHGDYFPNRISDAYYEICEYNRAEMRLHIYASFGCSAETFGRHNDNKDVFIVQAIGKIKYKFDDGCSFILHPGDSLFIKKGVYHNPIVIEPRVTLSFSRTRNKFFV